MESLLCANKTPSRTQRWGKPLAHLQQDCGGKRKLREIQVEWQQTAQEDETLGLSQKVLPVSSSFYSL